MSSSYIFESARLSNLLASHSITVCLISSESFLEAVKYENTSNILFHVSNEHLMSSLYKMKTDLELECFESLIQIALDIFFSDNELANDYRLSLVRAFLHRRQQNI